MIYDLNNMVIAFIEEVSLMKAMFLKFKYGEPLKLLKSILRNLSYENI